ncbi:RING finger protein 10 [Operophtera brumata]|uniref:RING finger protein 10 n=1 Tax=Operophtera brumata TaxID=104452 RepID=A0A0L7KQ97_OPEBR|nr:RING finger protein 10 [Operophtera brumata]
MEPQDGWRSGELGALENSNRTRDAERDRVRIEFYATYDVMTGVRIAATLGGFFALMVFLIVYKSRSKTLKALNDPRLVELAEAVVAEEQAVEEERQLNAAMEEALSERARSRHFTGEEPPWPRTARFASYGGGYGSLLTPPRRLSTLRGDSLPASVLRFADRRSSAGPRDRRFSSATCSSSGSSYLERRGSSVVCALPERRLSPCPSERLAPLASVSSVGPSFVLECDLASIGADSVFVEDSDSTDDEVEQFSTDSGGGEAAATGECTELSSRPVPRPLRVDHTSHSRETLF